jgi:3-hydroxybutyryl-CoA dehydratase
MTTFTKGMVFTLPAENGDAGLDNRYADAAEDHNPLHIDPEFAKTTRFGGTIAHGMLTAAFLQELLVRTFGEAWMANGELNLNFMAPVHTGDTVTAEGRVFAVREETGRVTLRLSVTNQDGTKVISGKASVTPAAD